MDMTDRSGGNVVFFLHILVGLKKTDSGQEKGCRRDVGQWVDMGGLGLQAAPAQRVSETESRGSRPLESRRLVEREA